MEKHFLNFFYEMNIKKEGDIHYEENKVGAPPDSYSCYNSGHYSKHCTRLHTLSLVDGKDANYCVVIPNSGWRFRLRNTGSNPRKEWYKIQTIEVE